MMVIADKGDDQRTDCDMNGNAKILEQNDEDSFAFEVSDEVLEAAASATPVPAAAMSFPSAPTVSILIMCCGDNN